jgi:hypothetical protein
MAHDLYAMQDDTSILPDYIELYKDVIVADVEILPIQFVPRLTSDILQLNIKYKQFSLPFASLPLDIQTKIQKIVMTRMTRKLENEKHWRSYRPE